MPPGTPFGVRRTFRTPRTRHHHGLCVWLAESKRSASSWRQSSSRSRPRALPPPRFVRGARAARLERRRQDREDVRAALLPRGDRAPTDGCPCLQQRRRRHHPGAHTGRDQTQRTRTTEPFIRQSRAYKPRAVAGPGRRPLPRSPRPYSRWPSSRGSGWRHAGALPGTTPRATGATERAERTTPDGDRQRASPESARSTPAQQLPFTVTPC